MAPTDRRERADSGSNSPRLAGILSVETGRAEIVSVEEIRSAGVARRERTRLLRRHRDNRTAAIRRTERIRRIPARRRLVRLEQLGPEHPGPERREVRDRARAALSATVPQTR